MGTEIIILIIVLVILAIIILYLISTYLSLKKLKITAKEQWSQVEIELKKRFDLIPSVLEILKNSASNEGNIIKGIIEARNKWTVASTSLQEMEASNQLAVAFKNLIVLSKGYPALKSDVRFLNIKEFLLDSEIKITSLSSLYNQVVFRLNRKLDMFPLKKIAKTFGYEHAEIFKLEELKKGHQRYDI